jgi:sugar lactone lactonase YvrE
LTTHYAADAEHQRLHLVDLSSGESRSLRLRESGDPDGWKGGQRSAGFAADGRVLFAGDGGVRRWDPATGEVEVLAGGPGTYAVAALDGAGRRAVANLGTGTMTISPRFAKVRYGKRRVHLGYVWITMTIPYSS